MISMPSPHQLRHQRAASATRRRGGARSILGHLLLWSFAVALLAAGAVGSNFVAAEGAGRPALRLLPSRYPPKRGAVSARPASSSAQSEGQSNGIALLNLVTMLFGSNQVLIKTLETDDATAGAMDSCLCMTLRFGIAALALGAAIFVGRLMSGPQKEAAPTEARAAGETMSNCVLICGAELSVWLFLGFMLQAVGLQYTTASSGALLGSLTIVIVPLLSLLDGRRINKLTWGSVGLAAAGTALFVGPNALAGAFCSLGDVMELGSAALFAVQMWRCEKLIRQFPESQVAALTCLQLAFVSGLSFVCVLAQGSSPESVVETVSAFPPGEWLQVVIMGLVTTAFCLWAEARALRDVDAPIAALIYACEPIWGAVFAYLWRGEMPDGPCAVCGAGLLLVASMAGVYASSQRDEEEPRSGGTVVY